MNAKIKVRVGTILIPGTLNEPNHSSFLRSICTVHREKQTRPLSLLGEAAGQCNEPLRLVGNAPPFAQFLPSHAFHCDRCRIALAHDDDELHVVVRANKSLE